MQELFFVVNVCVLLLAVILFVTTLRIQLRVSGDPRAARVTASDSRRDVEPTEQSPLGSAQSAEEKAMPGGNSAVLRLLDSASRGSTPRAGGLKSNLHVAASAPAPSPFENQLPLGLGRPGGTEPSWPSQEALGSASETDQVAAASPVGLAALRDLPEVLRARTMQAQLGSLEMGALLGQGSFGKVYKAKWRGTIVAVKIIEHGSSQSSKLDGVRESALSASFQHPNVLVTYKVLTQSIQKDPMPTYGSKDSARSRLGHTPSQPLAAADGASALTPAQSEPLLGHWPQGPKGLPLESRTHKDRLGAYEDTQETWMLMEYCDRGNLSRAISRGRFHVHGDPQRPDMVAIYRTLVDISAACEFLHSVGIIHGDLKACNVLLKSTSRSDDPRGFSCKVSDFGLSQILDAGAAHMTTETYGTVAYMPAELLREGKLSPAVDVYSFGCIMFELYQRERMFSDLNPQQIFGRVLMGRRQAIPEGMPAGYRDLLQACWDPEPVSRPPFSDITAWLRRLYYGLNGGERDSRQSLELNPWDVGDRASHAFARRREPSAADLLAASGAEA